jgi:hypothetical protein
MHGERRNMQVAKGQIFDVSWQVPVPEITMGCVDGDSVLLDFDLRRLWNDVFGDICCSAFLEGVDG